MTDSTVDPVDPVDPAPDTDPAPDPAPEDLGPGGRALWTSIADVFELAEHERALLHEACRVADRLDALDAVVRLDGVTVSTPQGLRAHPALVEARQQGVVLSRLVASLRLPDDDEPEDRPQRRGGARGAYAARRTYGSRSVGGAR
jgi:hypothetical protein